MRDMDLIVRRHHGGGGVGVARSFTWEVIKWEVI